MSRTLVLISSARSDPARVARPPDTVAAYRRFFLPAGRRLAEPDRLGCCRGPGLAPGAPRGGEPLLAARTAGTGSPAPRSPRPPPPPPPLPPPPHAPPPVSLPPLP